MSDESHEEEGKERERAAWLTRGKFEEGESFQLFEGWGKNKQAHLKSRHVVTTTKEVWLS